MISLMGNCVACLKKRREPTLKITLAILGLDNAGKTVTTKGLQGEPLDSVAPTIGFSSVEFKFEKCQVTMFDLGGGKRIRDIWRNYLAEIYGLIYVIDSSEPERLEECKTVLEALLEHDRIRGKPLLLLGNKQDKSGALDEIDLCEQLNLEHIVNMNKCPCRVETCSAITGQGKRLDQPITDGVKWLLQMIKASYEKLHERVSLDIEELKQKEAIEKKERAERVRKIREERERKEKEMRANGELPESDEDDVDGPPVGSNPFKRLDYTELEKKDAMLKEKKKKQKEAESAKKLAGLRSSDSEDDKQQTNYLNSQGDVRQHNNLDPLSKTPRGMRFSRSRSPSPRGRNHRSRSLSPPLRMQNGLRSDSKEYLVNKYDNNSDSEDVFKRPSPWNKKPRPGSPSFDVASWSNRDSDILSAPRLRGGLAPLAPLEKIEPKKKKKKKKARRNQVFPNGEEGNSDTPREPDDTTPSVPVSTPHDWHSPPQSRSSTHKASRSPRLESLTEPEHEMDSFSTKWGLVDDLPELADAPPVRNRPNSEYDDDVVT